jgi:hypothetical protein
MADQIKHGTVEVVNADAKVTDSALANIISATSVSGGTTKVPNISVDVKGRVTALSDTTVKMTGIDFCASGNTLVDQTVFVETTAPQSSDGENGDVWYQTIS